MIRILQIFLFLFIVQLQVMPQVSTKSTIKSKTYKQFVDTVTSIKNRIYMSDSLAIDSCKASYDIQMYRLFLAPVVYSAPISQKFMIHKKPIGLQPAKEIHIVDSLGRSISDCTKLEFADRDTLVNDMLYDLYLSDFDIDYVDEATFNSYESFKPVVVVEHKVKESGFALFKPEVDYTAQTKVESSIEVVKPNFWKLRGEGSVQFSQNFISKNWYKGGESSNSILSYLMFNINYNDKSRIEFDNRIEAKAGFMTMPSDTVHKYNINSDMLRLTSKIGIKAFSRWYYTLSAEFNTQFFNNYKVNSTERVSSFMAPANFIINVGLDYKLSLPKIELSTLYSPLTYNFRIVNDPIVDETQFGLEEGKSVLNSIGSSFQLNMRWSIISQIIWESRFVYFTNYRKIETEWENTYNFILNRYLSAKLFVHARFYDMEAEHKIQWNELFSFGINYKW